VKITTEAASVLHFRISNTTTGAVIKQGFVDAADSDMIDFIDWNTYDHVNPSTLRIKVGDAFKQLDNDDKAAIDAKSRYKTAEAMLTWASGKIGRDVAGDLLEALKVYAP
jgi:hypothetical protein